jgi:DNA sulfur modification protein DndD
MKFLRLEIEDFRQYYGFVEIDLTTDSDRNIVVIGGRNGYGKTNLLLAIVWCLYGDRISQIDDNFKKEIQKEKNYSSFMQQSINWTAKREHRAKFSVLIEVSDVELPENGSTASGVTSVIVRRTFDTGTMSETLSIVESGTVVELFNEEGDRVSFINDYLIPVDAAKFVFFDAEKIAELANLPIKEEGSFINDALGRILGLDVYEELISDLELYISGLQREGASKNLHEQILDKENAIKIANYDIERLEDENAEKFKEIDNLKKSIRQYDSIIFQHSKSGGTLEDHSEILREIDDLRIKEREFIEEFQQMSEIIPLAILTGKLEEVKDHLRVQEENDNARDLNDDSAAMVENFVELLFNKPPEPENSSMSLKDKLFYYEKAQTLAADLFFSAGSQVELAFEHDLNNAEKKLLLDAAALVNSQSKEVFQSTISQLNQTQLRLAGLSQMASKLSADLEDELVLEYAAKRDTADFTVMERNRQIGENIQSISKLREDISRHNQQLTSLVKKVDINDQNRRKIERSNEIIALLSDFLEEQKAVHKESLEKTILTELRILMHKLNSIDSQARFIDDVNVTILASGQGMKITLYDQDDVEIRKEGLSSGEKQIYISCLIKAILKESIKSLPIFIDTPLGRLDEEHRDTITSKFYPELSEQVVLFSTNSEITPKRYREIEGNVARAYHLANDGVNTTLLNGYFGSYEN